jgi:hypothetical protein
MYFFSNMFAVPCAYRYIDFKQTERLEKHFVKPPRKVDRSGKKTRFVATYRDAQFMHDLQALLIHPDEASWKATSVSKTLVSTMFPAVSPLKRRSKRRTWWELQGPGHRKHRTPADPRDISVYLRAEYLMLALRELGPVHSFTLDFRQDIEALACEDPSTGDFLRRRIQNHFQALLGRTVDFFFVIEQADFRRVHLHGCLGISAQEAEAARLALRKAGGEWEAVRQFQSDTDEEPDSKWNSYITMECYRTTKFMRALALKCPNPRPMTKFNGAPLFATRFLTKRSVDLYQSHRSLVLSALKDRHPAIIEERRQRAAAVIAFLESPSVPTPSLLHS